MPNPSDLQHGPSDLVEDNSDGVYAKVPADTHGTAQTSRAELAQGLRDHYEKISLEAHEWHNQIGIAIDLWEKHPETVRLIDRLQRQLVAARHKMGGLQGEVVDMSGKLAAIAEECECDDWQSLDALGRIVKIIAANAPMPSEYEKLKAEIKNLKAHLAIQEDHTKYVLKHKVDPNIVRCKDLERQLEAAKHALKWYSDYKVHHTQIDSVLPCVTVDHGQVARDAQAEIEKIEKE